MNATETAKAIKETKSLEELESFITEHNLQEDERKTVQTAIEDQRAKFTDAEKPEEKPATKQKAERKHGEVQNGTIYFKKKIPPTQLVNINGKKYMVLSDTVARDQDTKEKLTIVTD